MSPTFIFASLLAMSTCPFACAGCYEGKINICHKSRAVGSGHRVGKDVAPSKSLEIKRAHRLAICDVRTFPWHKLSSIASNYCYIFYQYPCSFNAFLYFCFSLIFPAIYSLLVITISFIIFPLIHTSSF
jgi:hypothetical protein